MTARGTKPKLWQLAWSRPPALKASVVADRRDYNPCASRGDPREVQSPRWSNAAGPAQTGVTNGIHVTLPVAAGLEASWRRPKGVTLLVRGRSET